MRKEYCTPEKFVFVLNVCVHLTCLSLCLRCLLLLRASQVLRVFTSVSLEQSVRQDILVYRADEFHHDKEVCMFVFFVSFFFFMFDF